MHCSYLLIYIVLLCNVFSDNIGKVFNLEGWNAKPVISLLISTRILLQIDIGIVADMETTWRHQKDG